MRPCGCLCVCGCISDALSHNGNTTQLLLQVALQYGVHAFHEARCKYREGTLFARLNTHVHNAYYPRRNVAAAMCE